MKNNTIIAAAIFGVSIIIAIIIYGCITRYVPVKYQNRYPDTNGETVKVYDRWTGLQVSPPTK